MAFTWISYDCQGAYLTLSACPSGTRGDVEEAPKCLVRIEIYMAEHGGALRNSEAVSVEDGISRIHQESGCRWAMYVVLDAFRYSAYY